MTHVSYKLLDVSHVRKAFVVGDIHGEFRKLDAALIEVGFQPEDDVLISVGDIVDRGPFSEEFEKYIDKPWFWRVLGDHELQPREYLLGYETAASVSDNGGDWFLSKPKEEIERIASLLEEAPLAMEVITPAGRRVGITHADLFGHWDSIQSDLKNRDLERLMINMLVGSRDVIRCVQSKGFLFPGSVRVNGVDHIFHGHTSVDTPLTVANRTWIDTDKGSEGGNLSVIDIDAWLDKLPSK
jgi:serine/threonine protein phosphatase 1